MQLFSFSIIIIASLLYYSPVTFYGYWTDAVVLLVVSVIILVYKKKLLSRILRRIIILAVVANILVVTLNSVSIFTFILMVQTIPGNSAHGTHGVFYINEMPAPPEIVMEKFNITKR